LVRGNTSCLEDLFCTAATGSDDVSASATSAVSAAAAAAAAAAASADVSAATVDAAAAAAADVPSRTFRALWMSSAASDVLVLGGRCSDPRAETCMRGGSSCVAAPALGFPAASTRAW
jgi:hypothetical protein